MKNTSALLLFIGIILLVNFLGERFFFRLDLTEDRQYTLSQATRDILEGLSETGEPVTVTAYFSDNLPPDIAKTKRDFQEMLVEYASLSDGYLNYEFVNPESEEQQQEALQSGIRPVLVNIREKDQYKQQQAYMGAVLKQGDRQEVIPFIQPGTAMEYALSTSTKKLAVVDKPTIGIIQGNGEPELSEIGQVIQQLSILYNVETIDLEAEAEIPARYRAVALIAPSDSIPPIQLDKLDTYLAGGGDVLVALNAVEGILQEQRGVALNTGVGDWLKEKGVEVEPGFVTDARCGSVTVQQRQGFFTIQTPVQFPFLPLVSEFEDHPVTRGLEQIILPFASPVRFLGKEGLTFTPLARSSQKAGIVQAPAFFDVSNKEWSDSDFPLSGLILAGILEGPIAGSARARMVVIGEGDFCVSGQQGQSKDNISFLVNAIDWLSDDTGLIELRTKGVVSRPLDELEDQTRSLLKYGNFLLPILLVVLYGLFRFQRQRAIRIRRMQERYI